MKRNLILLWLLALAGCQLPTPEPTATPTWPARPTVTSTARAATLPPAEFNLTPVQPATPAPLGSTPRTQYAIRAEYDYAAHTLTAAMTVVYANAAPEAIGELVFIVEPNRTAGIFTLDALVWGDGRKVGGYALRGGELRISLPEPLPAGKTISVRMDFTLALPERADLLGYTARQVNLCYWHPFAPYYQPGAGFVVHQPGKTGEYHVYELADFWVDLRLRNAPPDVVIAASAPARQDGDRYTYQHPAARNFVLSLSREYIVQTAQAGGVTIQQYIFPGFEKPGNWALQLAQQAVAFYEERFAPYPHPLLSIIQADVFDGMEFDGLYFLSSGYYGGWDGTPQNYLSTLTVHEIAHNWWYGLVASDQALEPWLDEALCTYTELLFYERHYPQLVDWWWGFRVLGFTPRGAVNSTIYDWDGFRPYVNAVYLRGAQFIQALRNLTGDEAFFAFLAAYPQRYAGRVATAADFFALLAEFTAADVAAVAAEYFR